METTGSTIVDSTSTTTAVLSKPLHSQHQKKSTTFSHVLPSISTVSIDNASRATTAALTTAANAHASANASWVQASSTTSRSPSHAVAAATAIVDEISGPVRLSKKRSLCDMASKTASNRKQQMSSATSSRPVVKIMSAPRMMSTSSKTTAAKSSPTASNKPRVEESRPIDVLMSILRSSSSSLKDVQVVSFEDIPSDFYTQFTEAQMEAYGSEVLGAIRSQDLDALRQIHKAGRPLNCANRFSESLVHLACRKSFDSVVNMLVNEAGVTLRVKDDFGRNPAHDACWTVTPNWKLMDLIVESCGDLLLVSDVRGHTPLDYVRREHWAAWSEYLRAKGETLVPKILVPSES
eukprot:CAMPEP_0113498088 /NCGR_PEP_ID=MMETSP0014_2-20120614/30967_1 /TAXON_ID=2857 /ORGANISM="Nitzschia sp." /LENGTH=349 /DNA_ID=CAMNT_0000392051 /DNA_START=228 /DNA_END=1277 /DNA_ORIENTATION=+ /assembly_acc=CAM_ASM_000159